MFRILFNNSGNQNEYEELVKVFLKQDEYEIGCQEEANLPFPETDVVISVPDFHQDEFCSGQKGQEYKKELDIKNKRKRYLYDSLRAATGLSPDWGILTGVRPVKLTGELMKREGSREKVREILLNSYYLNQEKADLLLNLWDNQTNIVGTAPVKSVGIYIGIPFCPTRCVYCSFPSNQVQEAEIKKYLVSLEKEITYAAAEMKNIGWYPETIYIGGGTPTTLDAPDLKQLLCHVNNSFDLSRLREFTVEAGRPDTITGEKLSVIRDSGADRISINPQSMNSKTLKLIGRNHEPEDIKKAFRLAKAAGIPVVNADIIAGLPEEKPDDFEYTLKTLLELEPQNITVHTLALKRASRLKEMDSGYHYRQGEIVRDMLVSAKNMLYHAGYHPYYLYRQKHMAGNFENIGYAKAGTEGIYNIRIMEEEQTIIALGAGGITKVYYPKENRLERVANVSNYEIYMDRLSEMLQRKADHVFHT